MKKLFFFAASLLVAGSMMANVTIDLSKGVSSAEAGATCNVTYNQGVCSFALTNSQGYVAGGVEFTLNEPIAASNITSITGEIKCDATGEYMELAVFVRDLNGHRWHSGTILSPYLMSDWTSINEVPSKTYWDGQDEKDYPDQTISSVAVSLSPGVAVTNYNVSVKNLVINTKGGTALPVVKAADKVTKTMVNGQLVIIRNGVAYSATGAAL